MQMHQTLEAEVVRLCMALLTQHGRRYWNLEASLKYYYKKINYLDYLELNGLNEMHNQKVLLSFSHEVLWQ